MKLSEIFRKVKARMWNGVNPRSTRSRYICDNIMGTRAPWDDAVRARNIIHNLIGNQFSLEHWLHQEHGIIVGFSPEEMLKMQVTRRAWLDHLIEHYEQLGD